MFLRPIMDHWKGIFGIVSLIAGVLTIIVYADTIRGWIVPKPPGVEYGNILITSAGGPFQYPRTFAAADPQTQQFFRDAHAFISFAIHNASQIEMPDLAVTVPVDSILEISRKDGVVQRHGPSQRFSLGSIGIGEDVGISIWLSRPFAVTDVIKVSHRYGAFHLTGGIVANPEDIAYYRNGYYRLWIVTIILALALLIFVIWVFARRYPPRSRRQYQRKKMVVPAVANEVQPPKEP